jgi:hypothetical protein
MALHSSGFLPEAMSVPVHVHISEERQIPVLPAVTSRLSA